MKDRLGLDREWTKDAECKGKWDLFDAQESVSGRDYYPYLTEAQAICATCPVFDLCKEAGEGERTGIWGGEPR